MSTYEELNPAMHTSKLLPPLVPAKLHAQVERTAHLSASPGWRGERTDALVTAFYLE
jgi:hypothetical protein